MKKLLAALIVAALAVPALLSQTQVANNAAELAGKTILLADGGTARSITGALFTFDRDPSAPFAVSSGSAKVSNLDTDLYDGLDSTVFARWDGNGTSLGQIKFPATQSASADANTLDDYEEGTWTPTLTFATAGDLTVAYTTQTGTYTKIGRQVTLYFNIVTSTFTHTTASGSANITGVPVTATVGVTGSMYFQGITKANYTQYVPRVIASTTLDVVASGSGQNVTPIAAADMPSAGTVHLVGSITYFQ